MMRGKGIGGILVGLWMFWGTSVWAQAPDRGVIESPSGYVSGIGFISGWKCNSDDITLKVQCGPSIHDLAPAQNMPRADTREECDGRIDNGWIIQVNWELWAGCSEVAAFDNGQQFASRKFTVGEIGDGFIRDQEGTQIKVPGFPSPDQVTHFAWSTATQHFEAMHTADCGTDDACPGNGEGEDGNNGSNGGDSAGDQFPIPEITINERVTAGTQPLPQYQGNLDFPLSNPTRAISYSVIFGPGDWMFLQDSSKGKASLLVPHDEIETKSRRISLLALKGAILPLLDYSNNRRVVNLIGVGIEQLYQLVGSSSNPDYFGGGYGPVIVTTSNDPQLFPQIPPDMTLPIPQHIYRELPSPRIIHFLNGETGEFGYRLYMERDRPLTDQEIQDLYYPNNNQGPWRLITGSGPVGPGSAIKAGGRFVTYFQPTETVIYRENFQKDLLAIATPGNRRFARDDLRGTGKLEIIYMSDVLYDYWVNPPDPDDTYFVDSPVEYRSAAAE